jgi:hypothetical protein
MADQTRQSRVGHLLPWQRRRIESSEGMSGYRDRYFRDYIRHAAFSRPMSPKSTPTPLAMRFTRLSTQSFSIATVSASIACIVNNSSRSPSRSDRQEWKMEWMLEPRCVGWYSSSRAWRKVITFRNTAVCSAFHESSRPDMVRASLSSPVPLCRAVRISSANDNQREKVSASRQTRPPGSIRDGSSSKGPERYSICCSSQWEGLLRAHWSHACRFSCSWPARSCSRVTW